MDAWPLLEAAIWGTWSDGCGSAGSATTAGSLAADLLQKQPYCFPTLNKRLCLAVPALALPCLARCSRSGFAALSSERGERP